MAPHSSTLAWKIPWAEEPGRLQSMGLLRVRHDWVTSLSLFTFMHWRRKWQPTPVFLPGESQGQGSLVGRRLWGCTESDTTEVTAAAGYRRICSWDKTRLGIQLLWIMMGFKIPDSVNPLEGSLGQSSPFLTHERSFRRWPVRSWLQLSRDMLKIEEAELGPQRNLHLGYSRDLLE